MADLSRRSRPTWVPGLWSPSWHSERLRLAAVRRRGERPLPPPAPTAATTRAGQVNLQETGSTLHDPLFNLWGADYTREHPNIHINTQASGSGTGIAAAISGMVQIGASDAYLAPNQRQQDPDLMNIPLAISAQQINYNIPGLNDRNLNLDGPILAGM